MLFWNTFVYAIKKKLVKLNMYKRFWFEFQIDNAFNFPAGIVIGCGVTAIDTNDAINLMDRKIFHNTPMPIIKKTIENIDIHDLDQGRVIPNMAPCADRGIWFPLGYEK